MSTDRRSRNTDHPRRRRQPSDQTRRGQGDAQAQQPRRRGSYVPRQGSGQPRRFAPDHSDDPREPGSARPAQQPAYRHEEQTHERQYDYYEDPDDDLVYEDEQIAPAPRGQRRRPASAPRQARNRPDDRYRPPRTQVYDHEDDYSDEYGDSFIDEDDWYEEEAAAGAARPRSARTPSRGARPRPRPSISMPRPSLPRPTIPHSVREAALVQDQNALILIGGLLVSVLLLALFTSNRLDTLAPGFATRISASGLPQELRTESALWQLPLMAGALLVMNAVLAWFAAQRSRFLSRFFLITVAMVQILIWVAFLRIAY